MSGVEIPEAALAPPDRPCRGRQIHRVPSLTDVRTLKRNPSIATFDFCSNENLPLCRLTGATRERDIVTLANATFLLLRRCFVRTMPIYDIELNSAAHYPVSGIVELSPLVEEAGFGAIWKGESNSTDPSNT